MFPVSRATDLRLERVQLGFADETGSVVAGEGGRRGGVEPRDSTSRLRCLREKPKSKPAGVAHVWLN